MLDVTATAPTLREARDRVYGALEHISWPGMHYRHDIAVGPRWLERGRTSAKDTALLDGPCGWAGTGGRPGPAGGQGRQGRARGPGR